MTARCPCYNPEYVTERCGRNAGHPGEHRARRVAGKQVSPAWPQFICEHCEVPVTVVLTASSKQYHHLHPDGFSVYLRCSDLIHIASPKEAS